MFPLLGQVGLISGPSTRLQHLICALTGTSAYHAVVVISPELCVSADRSGVSIQPLDKYPQAVFSRFPLTPKQARRSAQYAIRAVYRPYNWSGTALIALESLLHRPLPARFTRRSAQSGAYQCSELALNALIYGAKYDVFDGSTPKNLLHPGHLHQIFARNGWFSAQKQQNTLKTRLLRAIDMHPSSGYTEISDPQTKDMQCLTS